MVAATTSVPARQIGNMWGGCRPGCGRRPCFSFLVARRSERPAAAGHTALRRILPGSWRVGGRVSRPVLRALTVARDLWLARGLAYPHPCPRSSAVSIGAGFRSAMTWMVRGTHPTRPALCARRSLGGERDLDSRLRGNDKGTVGEAHPTADAYS